MNVANSVKQFAEMGISLLADGEKIRIRGPLNVIEKIQHMVIAHKPEILDYLRAANDSQELPADCIGSPLSEEGAPFWPWMPHISADTVHRMRDELAAMIDELAMLECWPQTLHDEILERSMRDPLIAWPDNLAHFSERLAAARAEAQARELLASRCWNARGLADRAGRPERRDTWA